jgi:hypothetical protein
MLRRVTIWNFKRFDKAGQTFEIRPITLLLGANAAGKSSLFQLLLAMQQSFEAGHLFQLHTIGARISLGPFRNVIHGQPGGGAVSIQLDDDALGTIKFTWGTASPPGASVPAPYGLLEQVEVEDNGSRATLKPFVEPDPNVDHRVLRLQIVAAATNGGDASPAAEFLETGPLVLQRDPDEGTWELDWRVDRTRDPGLRDVGSYASVEDHAEAIARRGVWEGLISRAEADWVDARKPHGQLAPLFGLAKTFHTWTHAIEAGAFYLEPVRHPGARVVSIRHDRSAHLGAAGEHLVDVIAQQPWLAKEINDDLKALEVDYALEFRQVPCVTGQAAELVLRSPANPASGGDEAKVEVGLPDVGFGIRQVVPVLALNRLAQQVATARFFTSKRIAPIVMVEQPELHLHPRLAVQLMSVLARVRCDRDKAAPWCGPILLLETHSEHMVLRLQKLVRQGRLDAEDDISILAVEPDEAAARTFVARIPLKASGKFARNWPRGFFVERRRELDLVEATL